MTDRLRARLRALDRPEDPSPAFRESLYQQLARRADIAPPTGLPLAAPVHRRAASGRRRWLPLLVAATVATSLAGGLAALSTRPAERACEPALAQALAEDAPKLDYTYTARGTMVHTLKTRGDGRFRLEGRHASPDRVHERYIEGNELALYAQGADESVRIGQERWMARTDPGDNPRWTTEVDILELGLPNLAVLPRDRVAFLLQGSAEPSSPVAWVAARAPDGVCHLTGTILPSPSSPARRILTVEVARNATLPTSIHEEWLDFEDLDGEWTHDVTWEFTPADGPPRIEPPPPETVAPPFMLPEIAEAQPSPRVTIDGLGSAVVDVAPGDPEQGEIRVTVLEIREDAGYGQSVPYPGTTFLAIRSRQEALQSADGGAGGISWFAVPSAGRPVLPVLARRIEGGYEPILETRLALRPGVSLEGWLHLVAPATGGVDAYWTLGGSTVEPSLLVRLRPDLVIGSGVVDGVPWEAVAYAEFGGRLCTIVGDRSGEDRGGGGACGPADSTDAGIVFASMSGQPLIAHGVTGAGVARVRLETTAGDRDVAVSSLASLGVARGAFAVVVPSGAEVTYFVALDENGIEVGRSAGPAAPAGDDR